jgi:hypothetical protein
MKTIKYVSILFFFLMAFGSSKIYAQFTLSIGLTVRDAPPPLPVYDQPVCPEEGYLWTPGYWAFGDDGYYWVPGVWVLPAQTGFLWTPGYWEFRGGYYDFHPGYWGPHIGYYGGVNYGYGYGGSGYYGGRWEGDHFRYNTAVVNVDRTYIHNTYEDRTVIVDRQVNRTSFNGPGGIRTSPTHEEEQAMRESHVAPTAEQTSHFQGASKDRSQFASVNKGRPATTAVNRVGGQSTYHMESHNQASQPARQETHMQQAQPAHSAPSQQSSHQSHGSSSSRPAGHNKH